MTSARPRDAAGIRVASPFRNGWTIGLRLGIILAGAVTPGYSHLSEPVSQLAAFGQPYPAFK
jgi:hypothetical protein